MTLHRQEKDRLFRHFIERTRLGGWHKAFLYGAVALLWITGLVWLVVHHRQAAPDAAGIESPVGPLMMKLHGAAAMAFLLVFGSLIPNHLRRGWALGRNRPSGIGLTSVCGFLVLSGWALYYAGSERLRAATSSAHWIVGLLLPLIIFLHILAWRLESRRADDESEGDSKRP